MWRGDGWRELFAAPIESADPEMAGLLVAEQKRQTATVNLIASESYCPRATIDAESSILVNKNATGYPGAREVAGCAVIDTIERLAVERARRLFGAEHANVQALASTVANVAVLRGLLKPGDTILSLDVLAGGHHSHGAPFHVSGQDYRVVRFGIDEDTDCIDPLAVRRLAEQVRPRMIIAGSTAYPRAIDFGALHAAAESVGAMLFADIAHVAGLVVAGLHGNPTPYADVVTTSTHKTLCGPRTGGLALSKRIHAEAIDAALFPGIQGAPGAHIIAGRAVLFELVGREEFRALMRAVVTNARALAAALAAHGLRLYTGGTDTHMVVIDLGTEGWDGRAVERALEGHGILGNATNLPSRRGGSGRAGLRLGTTAMTIRGMDEADFGAVGTALATILSSGPSRPVDRELRRGITMLAEEHPVPCGFVSTGPHSASGGASHVQ
jgi:glycine hydroxymethyltransferase